MDRLIDHAVAHSGSAAVAWCGVAWFALRQRLDAARADQRGMTTETVIITAGLAALAVTIVAIIANRVRSRARDIP